MKRQAVVDSLGQVRGLLPKGYRRAPGGNFEAGPRDGEGIRFIMGIFHVQSIPVGPKYTGGMSPEEVFGLFPLHWIE